MIDNIMIYSALGVFLLMALSFYLGTRKRIKDLEEVVCSEIDGHTEFKRVCKGLKELDKALSKLKEKVRENTSFKDEHRYIKIDIDKKIKEAGKMEMTPEDNEEVQLLKQEIKNLKMMIKNLSPTIEKNKNRTI